MQKLINCAKLDLKILLLLNDSEDQEDLMKDLISIITSFCRRIYGLRRAKNKLNKKKELVKNDNL